MNTSPHSLMSFWANQATSTLARMAKYRRMYEQGTIGANGYCQVMAACRLQLLTSRQAFARSAMEAMAIAD